MSDIQTETEARSAPDAKPVSQSKPTAPKRPPARKRLVFILIVVAAVAGIYIWQLFFSGPSVPAGVIALSGRLEGDDAEVASKIGGRVISIAVREGDTVKAGDTLAVFDDQQVGARKEQARAQVSEAEAKARSAAEQLAALREQLQRNEFETEQSKTDAQGRVGQAEADLAAAEADLTQQQASYQLAQFDKDAYGQLAKIGAVSERQGLQSAAAADQQAAAVASAKRRVEAARGALMIAQANLANPNIRGAQVQMVRRQIAAQEADLADAKADVERAKAYLAEAQDNQQDMTVTAPFGGMVMTRAAEPGEVVSIGTPIVTLLDMSQVYLRGFVPEGEIGKVKVGQPARIYLDSNPQKPIEAFVSRIDPQATFTPENIYFQDDRVKQVVGVKLQIREAVGFAKPGMPADGEIRVEGDHWPERGR